MCQRAAGEKPRGRVARERAVMVYQHGLKEIFSKSAADVHSIMSTSF